MSLLKKISILALAAIAIQGCKQDLPRSLDTKPEFGTVQEVVTRQDEKVLLYTASEDPYTKNWGSVTSRYVKVNDVLYPIHWDDSEKFKQLKVGDKVNLHPSEFIVCTGEADLKPTCSRLMNIYRSERRVNPIRTN